jgi:hypothetical protein
VTKSLSLVRLCWEKSTIAKLFRQLVSGLLICTECRGKLMIFLNCVHGSCFEICYEKSIRITIIGHALNEVLLRNFVLGCQNWISFSMGV